MADVSHLPRMRRQAVSKLRSNLTCLGQNLRGERRQLVAIFLVARERKYLRAESHKLDTVFVVPSEHLDNVSSVGKAQALDPRLTASDVGLLVLVWPVLRRVLGLRGICQRVTMVNDGRDAARP